MYVELTIAQSSLLLLVLTLDESTKIMMSTALYMRLSPQSIEDMAIIIVELRGLASIAIKC